MSRTLKDPCFVLTFLHLLLPGMWSITNRGMQSTQLYLLGLSVLFSLACIQVFIGHRTGSENTEATTTMRTVLQWQWATAMGFALSSITCTAFTDLTGIVGLCQSPALKHIQHHAITLFIPTCLYLAFRQSPKKPW